MNERGDAVIIILLIITAGLLFFARGLFTRIGAPTLPSLGGVSDVSSPTGSPAQPAPSADGREGSVTITGVSIGRGTTPSRVTLQANLAAGETVNVTGWRVQTNKRWFPIPQAVKTYDIVRANVEEDIVLEKDNALVLYLGISSPIGLNFRLNKCTGYLNERATLPFKLPRECPVPAADAYRHLAGWCQDYIRGVGRCELPDHLITNEWRGDAGNACRAFVNDFFSVANCYSSLGGKSGFLRNEWYAWVDGYIDVFDPSHDFVRLINAEGETIDDYTY